MVYIKWLPTVLVCYFFPTLMNCQTSVFDTGVKYYESIRWINFHIKESKNIYFLEFSPNNFMSYYDIEGKKLGEITYRLDYIDPHLKDLAREDLLNKNSYKFILNDTIILGYVKKRSSDEIVFNSPPVQVSHDETESFTTALVKLRKTELDIKRCPKKRIFKSSEWVSSETDKPLIIRKKKPEKMNQSYLKNIDGCIFLIYEKRHQNNIVEYTKHRVVSLGKNEMVIEFALNNPDGLVRFKRND